VILDIDLGNTRIKWRETTAQYGKSTTRSMPLPHVTARMDLDLTTRPRRVRVASVRGPEAEAELVSWCEHICGLTPEFARSTADAGGVRNGYEQPERLGVDRWLAILAAYNMARGGVVVIDVGTAITADGVHGSGQHIGGYICPGMRLMERSLQANTNLVRFADTPAPSMNPGINTGSAVSAGVLAAAVGFAQQSWSKLSALSGASIAMLTGGDAGVVAPHLLFPVELASDLVLDGLRLALP
jgi:type III pantothenate kinase